MEMVAFQRTNVGDSISSSIGVISLTDWGGGGGEEGGGVVVLNVHISVGVLGKNRKYR